MNWACEDQLSNLDPTYIAPNCHDKASCEALQTSDIDDPFEIQHSSPYNYIADKEWISKKRSSDNTATETCPEDHPACGLQTTLREAKGKACDKCYTRFRYVCDCVRVLDFVCVCSFAHMHARPAFPLVMNVSEATAWEDSL